MNTTSGVSVQWFWRVVIWLIVDVDISQVESTEIRFNNGCFKWTYSLQSSSTHSLISSSFDATSLENYISFGDKTPSSTSYVVRSRTELSSIPLDVEDLWIGRFDTSGITEFSFNTFQSLESLVIGNGVFWEVTCFELSNLPSLQSIDIGEYCFSYASLFSLAGWVGWLTWIHRSSSTTISQSWLWGIQSCSFGCVWEWLNEWIDDSDLPKIQSIQLASSALKGDDRDDRETISTAPYNYNNTLTMRSDIEWNNEWIDLPSLTSFKGDDYNFYRIGSVILESSDLVIDSCRYFSIIIQWNPIRWELLPLHLFPPILKYSFSYCIIIRCWWSRISHQRRKPLSLIPIPSVSLNFHW